MDQCSYCNFYQAKRTAICSLIESNSENESNSEDGSNSEVVSHPNIVSVESGEATSAPAPRVEAEAEGVDKRDAEEA